MKKIIILTAGLLLSCNLYAGKTVKICTDNGFWYPFTYTKDKQAVGLHIDVVSKALANLGYSVEYRPLPWKRCLSEAEDGKVDGVVSASYKDKRAAFMYYPSDAATAKKSDFRIQQVEYVVVTTANNDYEFDGDVNSIPQPVRAPRGYSIADDLKKKGLKVDDKASGDENNMKKLLRSGKGSLVTIPEVVKLLSGRAEYKGKFKISEKPVKSKSYYFTISKNTKLTADERQKIWEEIAKVREDKDFMGAMAAKY